MELKTNVDVLWEIAKIVREAQRERRGLDIVLCMREGQIVVARSFTPPIMKTDADDAEDNDTLPWPPAWPDGED